MSQRFLAALELLAQLRRFRARLCRPRPDFQRKVKVCHLAGIWMKKVISWSSQEASEITGQGKPYDNDRAVAPCDRRFPFPIDFPATLTTITL